MFKHTLPILALMLAIAPNAATADVHSYNQIIVFGDSLSDTGNLNSRSGYLQPPKYTVGRFTDGADTTPASTKYVADKNYNVIWHEQLAKLTQLVPAAPSKVPGGNQQNYAFGGATTGDGTTIVYNQFGIRVEADNMGRQVDDFVHAPNATSKALYVLWGGGNDVRNVFFPPDSETLKDLSKLTQADVLKAASQAASNIASQIATLVNFNGGGTMQFLWPDLPPIDLTPRFLPIDKMKLKDGTTVGDDVSMAVKQFKTDEEAQIAALLKQFASSDIKIVELDVLTAFNNIVANPAKSGYTNVTDTSQGKKVNPDDYLFWDAFHPTSHGHADIAGLALQTLTGAGVYAMPEPSGFATGLVMVAAGAAAGVFRVSVTGRRER